MDNLYILLLLPVLGATILAFIKNPGVARSLALTVSLLSLAMTIPFLLNFVPDASMQFERSFEWLPSYGIHFHIGMDGISLPLVLLTNTLLPLIILASFKNSYRGGFYALVLFMQAGLLLVFTALDAFLFYVGWEIALIPIYFICALWGDDSRIRVNMKFFVYTFLGSLIMLIAIIYLHLQVPERNFELQSFYSLALNSGAQGWVFLAFCCQDADFSASYLATRHLHVCTYGWNHAVGWYHVKNGSLWIDTLANPGIAARLPTIRNDLLYSCDSRNCLCIHYCA